MVVREKYPGLFQLICPQPSECNQGGSYAQCVCRFKSTTTFFRMLGKPQLLMSSVLRKSVGRRWPPFLVHVQPPVW